MSDSNPSSVYFSGNDDAEMQQAYKKARATFRFFWREITLEKRRIVPALTLACVKAPFSDPEPRARTNDAPEVEHMWFSDIDFDGRFVSGELLNAPNWLKTVKEGDSVRTPLDEISDWMYAIDGEVYGAYTVNLLRSRMGWLERRGHDSAWGLKFGDPSRIRVAREPKSGGGLLERWFGKPQATLAEPAGDHPMGQIMALSLKEQLAKDPSYLTAKDNRGRTLLHQEALAGNVHTVQVLLEAGADRNAVTADNMTPLQLARVLGWEKVVALLAQGQDDRPGR